MKLKILLIEDNPGDARLIKEMLHEIDDRSFELESCDRLEVGLDLLKTNQKSETPYNLILLDLSLPDSNGLETVRKAVAEAPDVPIVVMTGTDDDALGVEAIQAGAQDFLTKGDVVSNLLKRVIKHAIERHRLKEELRNLSLRDDLTGLYNRRGFMLLVEHHLRLSKRTKKGFCLLFFDMDGLKNINDSFGHQEGGQALKDLAEIMSNSFRSSDIIARFGGDEFVVLAIESLCDSCDIIIKRLYVNIKAHNTQSKKPYKLSVSVGAAYSDPKNNASIEELIAEADQNMYTHKRSKQKKT